MVDVARHWPAPGMPGGWRAVRRRAKDGEHQIVGAALPGGNRQVPQLAPELPGNLTCWLHGLLGFSLGGVLGFPRIGALGVGRFAVLR